MFRDALECPSTRDTYLHLAELQGQLCNITATCELHLNHSEAHLGSKESEQTL